MQICHCIRIKLKNCCTQAQDRSVGNKSKYKCKMKAGLNENKHVFMQGKKHLIPGRTFAYWFKLKDHICTAGS